MKGQISRYSWVEGKHYSGAYQIQGGMVTDADLGETSEIARARTDQLGDDAIDQGVPARGGIIAINASKPALKPGLVYADGVRGVVEARSALADGQPLDLYSKQKDFPSAPAIGAGAGIFYADIWQRAVFPLEDGDLTDFGLHAAQTSFRGKTMAQIKWSPQTLGGQAVRPMIEAGNGAFPRKGNAVLTCTLAAGDEAADPCDPCADQIPVELRIPNALFRLEVVHVVGPANAPQSVQIAWSKENAAEQYPVGGVANGFGDSGVFEFFSEITESHMGAFADPARRKRSAFTDAFPGAPRARDDDGGGAWPYVRRWDGHADVNIAAPAITATLGAGFSASVDTAAGGVKAKVVIDVLTLSLDLKTKSVLPGDHWLVELREFAPDGSKIKVLNGGLPVGIDHHYCGLFQTAADGTPAALGDADRRKLSFPPLSDLPARNVSLDPNTCPKLFEGAENVQDALSNLCAIDASDIAFTDNCPVLYNGAGTVQDALDALCKIDFSADRGYRSMFDWGVVCGINVRLLDVDRALIRIEPGSFLDRSGRFHTVGKPIDVSLNDREKVQRHFEKANADVREFCIAIARDANEDITVHLYLKPGPETKPEDNPFGPPDPGFCEAVMACQQQKGFIDPFPHLKIEEADKHVMQRLMLAASTDKAFETSFRVSRNEAAVVDSYVERLGNSFKDVAAETEVAAFNAGLAAIERQFGDIDATASVAEIRRGQKYVAIIDHIKYFGERRIEDCVCNAIVVPCPPPLGKPPFVVPVACVEAAFDGERFSVKRLCVTCCRKQALTLRAMRYRQGGGWENDLASFGEYCCTDKPVNLGVLLKQLRGFQRPDTFLNIDCFHLDLKPDFGKSTKLTDNPDIKALTLEDARRVMVGNGADVVDVIDISQTDAMDKILGKIGGDNVAPRLQTGERINPGDKVAILQRGGVAQGFVVLEKGEGKLLFDRPEAKISDISTGIVFDRLKEAAAARDAMLADIDSLNSKRAALEQQVSTMHGAVETLTKAQTDIAAQLERSRIELGEVGKQRDQIVGSFRASLPLNMVLQDTQIVAKLAAGGITTLGEAERLSDDDLKKLVEQKVFKNREEVKAFKDNASNFIHKPIG